MLVQRGAKVARLARDIHNLGGCKNLNVAMKKPPPQTLLTGLVRLHRGQQFAHPAAVDGKLVIQLLEYPADMRGFVHQKYMVAGLCQIDCRPEAADACPNDQCGSGFFCHYNASVMSLNRRFRRTLLL